jgi:hypothetical protein
MQEGSSPPVCISSRFTTYIIKRLRDLEFLPIKIVKKIWFGDTEQAEQNFCWQAGCMDGRLVRRGSNFVVSDGKGITCKNAVSK